MGAPSCIKFKKCVPTSWMLQQNFSEAVGQIQDSLWIIRPRWAVSKTLVWIGSLFLTYPLIHIGNETSPKTYGSVLPETVAGSLRFYHIHRMQHLPVVYEHLGCILFTIRGPRKNRCNTQFYHWMWYLSFWVFGLAAPKPGLGSVVSPSWGIHKLHQRDKFGNGLTWITPRLFLQDPSLFFFVGQAFV